MGTFVDCLVLINVPVPFCRPLVFSFRTTEKKAKYQMISFHLTGDALWQRMERAVQKVQERLERTAATLEQAGVPYAIIGGNAVRAWVAQADEAAVRTTRDVDILLRRSDWPAAVAAMERAGFVYRHVKSIDMFLDGP